ncbi:MAG: alpha-amylase family glycosyl hydrolase [Patescibacteria group bacterium]
MKNDDLKNNWSRNAVVYQIYPLSFKDSNHDGSGDLNGIISALDYLNDGTPNSLGIGAIWISPIYKSPMKDCGYDISDYYDINPLFGTLEDFDRLIKEAHKRGVRIIMDFVINHTSNEHPWFLESKSSLNNPRRDWYIWRDPKEDGSPPNNWLSISGGSAWTFDETTKQYYFHSFLPEQPDLNWRTEAVRGEMMNVVRFWLKRGVDGFRVDALDTLVEDGYLRDDPANPKYDAKIDGEYTSLKHSFSRMPSETKYCTNILCNTVSEFENKFIISEAYAKIPLMAEMFKSCDKKIHSPFNFNLMKLPWKATEFKKFVDEYEKSLHKEDWPNYVFGNHDRPRLQDRIGEAKLKVAAMLLLTLRGMPFIYYGEEIGMKNANIPESEIKDMFALRANNPKSSRDPERSPMQWNSDLNAGFGDVKPWLPLSDDYKETNVEIESKNPNSLLTLYKELIHLRNNSIVLKLGSYKSLKTKSPDIFSYVREREGKRILVILNFSDNQIEEPLPPNKFKVLVSTDKERKQGEDISGNSIAIKPNGGYVLEVMEQLGKY